MFAKKIVYPQLYKVVEESLNSVMKNCSLHVICMFGLPPKRLRGSLIERDG